MTQGGIRRRLSKEEFLNLIAEKGSFIKDAIVRELPDGTYTTTYRGNIEFAKNRTEGFKPVGALLAETALTRYFKKQ